MTAHEPPSKVRWVNTMSYSDDGKVVKVPDNCWTGGQLGVQGRMEQVSVM